MFCIFDKPISETEALSKLGNDFEVSSKTSSND